MTGIAGTFRFLSVKLLVFWVKLCFLGENQVLRTISIGTCVSVQGLVVGQTADGKLIVRVDEKTFVGRPVEQVRAA